MRANCGHRNTLGMTDHRGYKWCARCGARDAEAGIRFGNRAVVELDEGAVLNWDFSVIGTVVERVQRGLSLTPTGGRYASDRMTIVDKLEGNRWYANGPKTDDGNGPIVLRRA